MPFKVLRSIVFSLLSALAGWLVARAWLAPAPLPVATQPAATNRPPWFERVRPHCNTVEVLAVLQQDPPDLSSTQGVGLTAACLALAGRTDSARTLIFTLPPNERHVAAGIVFDIGHPVADMGDDKSAGPIMELVAFFWPTHYMALYHAGASAYQLGDYTRAAMHLDAFLRTYTADDGWTGSARGMLTRMRETPHAPPVRDGAPPG